MTPDQEGCQSFSRLAGYYRRFVPGYAIMAAPLSDLTRKGKPEQVLWRAECEVAFEVLKRVLASAPVLQIVDPSKPFTLQMDVSGQGLRAVLSQVGADGEEHPIAYASRKLLPREESYVVI